jgi:WD40 repeat protein
MKIQLMSMCALMMNLSYASHRDYRDYYKATTSQMPKELKEGTPAYRQAYLTLLNQKIQAAEREKRLSTAVDTKQGDAKKDTTVSRLRTLLSDHLLADLLSIILCYAGIWEQHDLSHHYHDKEITSVSRATLSPDGQLVAAICDSNNYIPTVWNSSTGNVLYRVYGLHEPLHCAFSPDSSLLATSGDDVDCGEIDLWDVKTGAHLRQSDRTPGDLIRVRFSNNGQCLVSFGDHDGEEVRLWNVQDGKMSKGLALNGAKNNNADHMAGAFRMMCSLRMMMLT